MHYLFKWVPFGRLLAEFGSSPTKSLPKHTHKLNLVVHNTSSAILHETYILSNRWLSRIYCEVLKNSLTVPGWCLNVKNLNNCPSNGPLPLSVHENIWEKSWKYFWFLDRSQIPAKKRKYSRSGVSKNKIDQIKYIWINLYQGLCW